MSPVILGCPVHTLHTPRPAEGQPAAAPWALRWPSGRPGALGLSAANAAPRTLSSTSHRESPSLGPWVPIQSP
jgi:hypothetical protein